MLRILTSFLFLSLSLSCLIGLFTPACSPREEDPLHRQEWGECTQNIECGQNRICRNRKCVEVPVSVSRASITPPEGMVLVPAGEFVMGANRGTLLEKPQVQSRTTDFFLDIREVTIAEYEICRLAGHCPAPACDPSAPPDHPVACVTQPAASAYCTFVRKRLPTEEEWEKAARGTDVRTYPWGEIPPTCEQAVFAGCGTGNTTVPVGTRPAGAGPFGTLDQAGNVWEWTATGRDPWDKDGDPRRLRAGHARSAGPGNTKPAGRPHFVIRGGSFLDPPLSLRVTHRLIMAQDFASRAIGFRCAADIF